MTLRIGLIRDIDLLIDIDNDASSLFEEAGMRLNSAADRELVSVERARWRKCLSAATVLIALDRAERPIGFAAVGERDGESYLDQLSVRRDSMRQGVGTRLLYASMELSMRQCGSALWLTTYDHLSWNRPYYERHGFVVVVLEHCGAELRDELSFERRLLPDPEHRVPMRRDLSLGTQIQRLRVRFDEKVAFRARE
jgi:GNAT superfamily N-acetyltransferase